MQEQVNLSTSLDGHFFENLHIICSVLTNSPTLTDFKCLSKTFWFNAFQAPSFLLKFEN